MNRYIASDSEFVEVLREVLGLEPFVEPPPKVTHRIYVFRGRDLTTEYHPENYEGNASIKLPVDHIPPCTLGRFRRVFVEVL